MSFLLSAVAGRFSFNAEQSIFTLLLKWKQQCLPWCDTSCTRKQVERLTSRSLPRSSKQIWGGRRFPGQTCSPGATTSRRWLRGWFGPGPGWASTRRPSGSIRRHCGRRHKSQFGWTVGPSQFLQTTQSVPVWVAILYMAARHITKIVISSLAFITNFNYIHYRSRVWGGHWIISALNSTFKFHKII